MSEINPGLINYQQGLGSAVILPKGDQSSLKRLTDIKAKGNDELVALQAREKARQDQLTQSIVNRDVKPPARRDMEAVRGVVDEMQQYIIDQQAQGKDEVFKVGTPEWKHLQDLQQRAIWGAEQSVAEQKWVDETIIQIRMAKDPYLDKEKAIGMILQHYYGQDGGKNIYTEDYGQRPNWEEAFNEGAWLQDFVDDLPEIVSQTNQLKWGPGGTFIETEQVKGKLFELNEDGTIKTDQEGRAMIKASDETVRMALQDSRFKRYIEEQLSLPENADKNANDLVKEKLQGYGFANVIKDRKKGYARDKPRSQRSGYTQEDIFARQEVIERTQKNVEQQYSSLLGGRLPNGKRIEDVIYDQSNSRITLNNGDYEIDLSAQNNGGFEELWNLYNTVPGFKRIDIKELKENQDYRQQYGNPKDLIDYQEGGLLDMDVNKVIASRDIEASRQEIKELLTESSTIDAVDWVDEMLKVKFADGKIKRFDLSADRNKLYQLIQDLLIQTDKKRYQAANTQDPLGIIPKTTNQQIDPLGIR